jgi:DNA-binding response OmpR family regulator
MAAKRILIVDDDPDVLNVLSRNFALEGYDVTTACNGHEAMIKAVEKQPNVVLLDYMMPVLDGLDVLREIKKEMPDTFVIVITGKGSIDVAVEAMKRGAKDYIRKPFDLDKISELVNANIEEYYDTILARNGEYAYPLDDEVIHGYEFLRTVYTETNPDITKLSAKFGYSRNAFYKFDREVKKYGVRGLFDKGKKELEEKLGTGEEFYPKRELPRPEVKETPTERYPFNLFINPNDKVQMKLEMLREAATSPKPHIGKISRKYGYSRQLFYTLHERFSQHGALGVLSRKKRKGKKNR